MKLLPFSAAFACLLAASFADDQIRDVQGALKSRGFYYGEVTGAGNAETDAALRRFQIRTGITVTGKLNADTLAALGLVAKKPDFSAPPAPDPRAAAAIAKAATPSPAKPPRATVKSPATTAQVNPAAPPEMPALPPRIAKPPRVVPDADAQDIFTKTTPRGKDPAVVEPPSPVPVAVSSPFTIMFRDTPYENARRDLQVSIVRRAQAIMAARKVYRGPLDGIAGPATSESIFLFQAEADLPRTGRLDLDTLAEMDLLPRAQQSNPLLKPFRNPNRHRDTSVDTDSLLR